MARKRLIAKSVTDTDDCVSQIKTLMVAAGWTLHDDQWAGGGYMVLKSTGETGTDLLPIYIYITKNNYANYINFRIYGYWDSSTHAGTNGCYYNNYSRVLSDDDAGFYLWVFATKDRVSIVTKVGTTYQIIFMGLIKPLWTTPLGTLQSGVSSGSSITLALGTGEAADFVSGRSYQIAGAAGEGVDWVLIDSVNAGSDQITVNNLPRNYGAGSKIGALPHPYIMWHYLQTQMGYGVTLPYSTAGTGNKTVNNLSVNVVTPTAWAARTAGNYRTGKNPLNPIVIGDPACGPIGYLDDDFMTFDIGSSTNEDTVSQDVKESGTSTGANGAATLNDTAKSWTADAWAGKAVIITDGTGAGQIRAMTANSATQLTVDENWSTTPDSTSEYNICSTAWRHFRPGAYGWAMREV